MPRFKISTILARQAAAANQATVMPQPQRLLHSISQVRDALGVSHATVYNLFAKGLLVPRKILGKTVVSDTDLQAFVASLAPAPIRVRPAGEQDAA
jgi:hypothetical protein